VHRAQLIDLIQFSLLSLSAVFFVVDPIALVPVFLGMTQRDPEQKRRRMALRAAITAGGILTLFALAGTLVFKLFGFTFGAFKVAGGILLLLTSMEMLAARRPRTRVTAEEEREGEEKEDVAIFPLAIPLLAGPGAIATVMTLMARAGRMLYAIPVVLSIALTCVASYFILRTAGRIARVLGVTGLTVVNRIVGLFIAALAVQFIFDGVATAFPRLAE
jgi:multiple antibiotic resistance protein